MVDEERFDFDVALDVAKKVFNYTNHTLLAEALEKWDVELFRQLFPRILSIIEQINSKLEQEMRKAAKELDFEKAMQLRDILFEMKANNKEN